MRADRKTLLAAMGAVLMAGLVGVLFITALLIEAPP